VVNGKLQFVGEPDLSVFHTLGPLDVVDAFDTLQESDQSFQPVGDFGGNQIEIDAAALLKIRKLGDLQTVEHHLPADAPCSQCGSFPVIFLELNIVLRKIDADGFETPEILI